MNLMFRKNFREGTASKFSISGTKVQLKAHRSKRSRDMGISQPDEIHYRTHLFFPTNRIGYDMGEERCSSLSGVHTQMTNTDTASGLTYSGHEDARQPLVDRKPSMSLLKWNNSISLGSDMGKGSLSFPVTLRSEPISLTTLDQDCFIIPAHSIHRFLPAGIPLPAKSGEIDTGVVKKLNVLEISDPKLCILVHLMSPLEPVDPILESPLTHPLLKQRDVASDLLCEVQKSNTAVGGMLLANMEKNAEFPFIAYYFINTTITDPAQFYSTVRVSSLSKFEPKTLKYTAAHTLDLYSEVAAIYRPPFGLTMIENGQLKKTQTAATGYIISVFKVFEGDDGEQFEKNWLYWTGARMLYRYLPRAAGLRRIALHKSTSQKGDKMYLLICECADLLKDISSAAVLVPALRARLCGYIGLFRPVQVF